MYGRFCGQVALGCGSLEGVVVVSPRCEITVLSAASFCFFGSSSSYLFYLSSVFSRLILLQHILLYQDGTPRKNVLVLSIAGRSWFQSLDFGAVEGGGVNKTR